MGQYFLGNTLINDSYIGSIRTLDLIAQQQALAIEYVVVAGGGAGGFGTDGGSGASHGGGGGAGGLLSGSAVIQPNQTSITAIVGNGGVYSDSGTWFSGQNSSFIGSNISVTSTGGGRGGTGGTNGANGGSGGGAARVSSSPGSGTSGQGFSGGVGGNVTNFRQGGCGGGASGAGVNVGGNCSAGPGATWFIFGTYSQGGRGANAQGAAGGVNTGNGGAAQGNGGSGIIHIRYLGAPVASGGTITQSGGYTYHTFTSGTGSFTY